MAPSLGGEHAILPLWWCLSLGACFGGNDTLVGASANLTVAGLSERNGVPFRFITYTLYAAPLTIVSFAMSNVYVWWRYFFDPAVPERVAARFGTEQIELKLNRMK